MEETTREESKLAIDARSQYTVQVVKWQASGQTTRIICSHSFALGNSESAQLLGGKREEILRNLYKRKEYKEKALGEREKERERVANPLGFVCLFVVNSYSFFL